VAAIQIKGVGLLHQAEYGSVLPYLPDKAWLFQWAEWCCQGVQDMAKRAGCLLEKWSAAGGHARLSCGSKQGMVLAGAVQCMLQEAACLLKTTLSVQWAGAMWQPTALLRTLLWPI
jgi:hypothetical protein